MCRCACTEYTCTDLGASRVFIARSIIIVRYERGPAGCWPHQCVYRSVYRKMKSNCICLWVNQSGGLICFSRGSRYGVCVVDFSWSHYIEKGGKDEEGKRPLKVRKNEEKRVRRMNKKGRSFFGRRCYARRIGVCVCVYSF